MNIFTILVMLSAFFGTGNSFLDHHEHNGYQTHEAILYLEKLYGTTDLSEKNLERNIVDGRVSNLPSGIQFQNETMNIFDQIDVDRMELFLTTFVTRYSNRDHSTSDGVAASLLILSELQNSIAESNYTGNASVNLFSHVDWPQPSVISRIEGFDPELKSQVIIIGAHLDSISNVLDTTGIAPGADDNAAACAVLVEVFRSLIETSFIPKRTLEFQFYAAEEVGLRGSYDVAKTYTANRINVHSMVNYDIVGFYSGQDFIGFHRDFTDDSVTNFLKKLVAEYSEFESFDKPDCGYPCSDHAPFYLEGFRTAFPVELDPSPFLHKTTDTLPSINLRQLHEFTKIAVAYMVEVGEPQLSLTSLPKADWMPPSISSSKVDQKFQEYHSIYEIKKILKHFEETTGNPKKTNLTNAPLPSRPNFQSLVQSIIDPSLNTSTVNIDLARLFLINLVSLHRTRNYETNYGKAASYSIFLQAQEAIALHKKYHGVATVEEFQHSWLQPSIIIRLDGDDDTLKKEIVILGAHVDSENSKGINRPAPGANDNASGASAVFEVFRSLLAANFVPKRTIEFQFYAAEEDGLKGSHEIAQAYASSDLDVHSMINYDVIGFNNGSTAIGFHSDYINEDVTNYLKMLVDEYLIFGAENKGDCGYPCSDHGSFFNAGFRTAFPVERVTDFSILHTEFDTIEKVNIPQIHEFIKLGVAYLIEIGEPSYTKSTF